MQYLYISIWRGYKDGVIFYSLGNFIFQTETVDLQPYDAYINKGMPLDTKVGDYMNQRSKNGTVGYGVLENIWRAVMASWTIEDDKVTEVKLYPISLDIQAKRAHKGVPHLLHTDEVLLYLADLSAPFGTTITIEDGVGILKL